MNTKLPALALTLALMAGCGACGHNDTPVPRREAYARINAYSHRYEPVGADTVPVTVMAPTDADATVSRGGKGAWWVTIRYPRYRASIYVTILPVHTDSISAIMTRRMERLALDMGSSAPRIARWERGNFSGISATAPWVLTTPAKMMAHDGRHLVSATVYCEGYNDADQLAPVAGALITDMNHLLPDD